MRLNALSQLHTVSAGQKRIIVITIYVALSAGRYNRWGTQRLNRYYALYVKYEIDLFHVVIVDVVIEST